MSKPFQRGLIVGKFCPLHRGHEHAIRQMIRSCKQPYILSYTRPEFPGCEPERRRRWLETLFPEAQVLVLQDESIPPNDADDTTHRRFVARVCREIWRTTVDAVFTSEDYGEGFARELTTCFRADHPSHPEVQHISVDAHRLAHPVFGTALRADIHGLRHHLPPFVYADFVQRVCLLGGESSGKSTLAVALAGHFETAHVAEYGRELWELQDGHLAFDDLLKIARVQVQREDEAAGQSHRYLFCDTSPLTTLFYSRNMFGKEDPELAQLADRPYALHVLCAPDFPFIQDGTRRDECFRLEQHAWYQAELTRRRMPSLEVSGSLQDRVVQVASHLAATSPPPPRPD